jgi:hypothetical protein
MKHVEVHGPVVHFVPLSGVPIQLGRCSHEEAGEDDWYVEAAPILHSDDHTEADKEAEAIKNLL